MITPHHRITVYPERARAMRALAGGLLGCSIIGSLLGVMWHAVGSPTAGQVATVGALIAMVLGMAAARLWGSLAEAITRREQMDSDIQVSSALLTTAVAGGP